MADLKIVVDVRDNQTMSNYKVPKSDKVEFVNASTTDTLVITPKPPATTLPFCETTRRRRFRYHSRLPPVVRELYTSARTGTEQSSYTAQIGTAAAEDPIVIIEKPKLTFHFRRWPPAGAFLAAVTIYFIIKSRASRTPQQG